MILLKESIYEDDLKWWLPRQLFFLKREYSWYPDENTFAYRTNKISGKIKGEVYFSGKYYSRFEPPRFDEKIILNKKVKCYEYEDFPSKRVSHLIIFNWLKNGSIGKYTIDYKNKKIILLNDLGVKRFGPWLESGSYPETYDKGEFRNLNSKDFEIIGKLASERVKSDGYSFIYEHNADNSLQNLISLG